MTHDAKSKELFGGAGSWARLAQYGSSVTWGHLAGFLLGVGIVAGILSYMHAGARESRKGQAVTFDPAYFDFGTVFQAETIRHEFRLVNHTTNEALIVGLRSSCSCTIVSDLTGKTIPPQDSVLVPVEFYSGSDRGKGRAKLEALLQIDDRRYYTHAFLEGKVDADFEFEPNMLDFNTLKPGERATQMIRFWPRALQGFSVVEPASTGDFQVSLLTNRVGSELVYELHVTFHAPMTASSRVFSHDLHVRTTSERVPTLRVPVAAVVRPEAEIYPQSLVIVEKTASNESRFTIRTSALSRMGRATLVGDSSPEALWELHELDNPARDAAEVWDATGYM